MIDERLIGIDALKAVAESSPAPKRRTRRKTMPASIATSDPT